MTQATVTAIVTSIPTRREMLACALSSVHDQIRVPDDVIVRVDADRHGPAHQRNEATLRAGTEWVAFLDDDDWWYADHLESLLLAAAATGADLVYPWFDLYYDTTDCTIRNDLDPLWVAGERAFGRVFDDTARDHLLTTGNFIPVTVLVRREALLDVGGFPLPGTVDWPHKDCEDWGAWRRLAHAGAQFHHVPRRTWGWRWHRKNTSGRTDRW